MATSTICFPSSTGDLWMLANATVYDARTVASELPEKPKALVDAARSAATIVRTSWQLRGDFRRLAGRQEKLIARLNAATPEAWEHENCDEMSHLLEELVRNERDMLDRAFDCPRLMLLWWNKPLVVLREQVRELDWLCTHTDALSVREAVMPGDEEMREFLHSLNSSDEYDFSVDRDHRKAHTLV